MRTFSVAKSGTSRCTPVSPHAPLVLVQELAYPEIPRPSAPATTAYRQQREKAEASRRAKAEAVQRALKLQDDQEPEPVKPQTPKKDPFEGIGLGEVKKFHKIVADHFRTRFAEMRTGFRLLDQDQSGTLSKKEMRALVHLFNLNVPDRLVDAFLALADYKNVCFHFEVSHPLTWRFPHTCV